MVRPTGFEPVAPRLGIWCSIRLSYGRYSFFNYTNDLIMAIGLSLKNAAIKY